MGKLLFALVLAGCASATSEPTLGDDDDGLQCPAAVPDNCSGTCTDLSSDADHCGTCDHACGADQTCSAGDCTTGAPAGCTGSEPLPPPVTFAATGVVQMYTVPTCVTSVRLEAFGAQGQGGFGGLGGSATGDLAVTPGETLVVFVGGANGFGGGGAGNAPIAVNGGGASDVRQAGDQLAHRVIVAGGGGGGSQGDVNARKGGAGGGGTCGTGFCGGGGGDGWQTTQGPPGGAGGQTGGAGTTGEHAGGAGGGGFSSGGGGSCQTFNSPMTCGGNGVLGIGGDGGPNAVAACHDMYGGTAGGGGGLFGGGGTQTGFCGGGGGGGGSSFVGSLANSAMSPGVQTGDGHVVITPLP